MSNSPSPERETEPLQKTETPTVSLSIQEAAQPPPPAITVPDGGLQAWLSVLGGYAKASCGMRVLNLTRAFC